MRSKIPRATPGNTFSTVTTPKRVPLRPSEIDKNSRVRARMDFPGFGPALDKEFVKGESIPEKKLDKKFLNGESIP